MIVDAECGMPLDLGKWECLWEQDADDSELNPDPNNLPVLDPKDQFLLLDPSASFGTHANHAASGSGTSTPSQHVTWLRKTEYLSRDSSYRQSPHGEQRPVAEAPIDVSRGAQIRDIEASFGAANDNFDLSTLKHPNKPNVTAVDSYEVLPDANIWANAYDLFRFSERPGDKPRPPDEDDPRLDCAVLRPMESEGDHFLAYYLTKDDDTAVDFKRTRLERPVNGVQDEDPTTFHFVRDYEVVKVEQEVSNELLLVLDDGQRNVKEELIPESEVMPSQPRAKGAYYKNIERKMLLKKKRINSYDQDTKKWHMIKVQHIRMDDDEAKEREEAEAEVKDPNYLLSAMDADAEGEVADAEGEVDTGDHEQAGGEEPIDPLDVLGD
ncbi:RNA polymerase II-associated protein [Phanerochaete sordida]|uniref:RNA polymerase II-associated protein n=1 Tax=Phanerochaete sordida TaxID=48140 RepID=A0A9P3LCA6_9APHY|nr:RNA polymerase II-associated protein [Phanerochaete sordida]